MACIDWIENRDQRSSVKYGKAESCGEHDGLWGMQREKRVGSMEI